MSYKSFLRFQNWPYANKLENGQFEGFCIDLLNEISTIAKITYTLKLSSDGQYGGWLKNGSVNGMIGEVYRNVSFEFQKNFFNCIENKSFRNK